MTRLSTSGARAEWSPACSIDRRTITLHGGGRITVRAEVVDAFLALDDCLRAHNYRTRVADTGAYNCRRITGGTGYSLHAYGIAADLNWATNGYGPRLVTDMPPAMVADILAIRCGNGALVFGWGGNYPRNKDAMHYEVLCTRGDLATGIRRGSIPTVPAPAPPAQPKEEALVVTKEDEAKIRAIVADEVKKAGTALILTLTESAGVEPGSAAYNLKTVARDVADGKRP